MNVWFYSKSQTRLNGYKNRIVSVGGATLRKESWIPENIQLNMNELDDLCLLVHKD